MTGRVHWPTFPLTHRPLPAGEVPEPVVREPYGGLRFVLPSSYSNHRRGRVP